MRWVPFVLNCVLILYAVLLRTLIYFRRDVFALREWTTQYAWVVFLAFIILGVAGVFLRRDRLVCALTIVAAVAGAVLWYIWFSTFQTV